ncbi:MAG: DUF971 domain-containing protein [Melioribacteraceae bacterium]|nr:DUF971 domain-containing protein [Melioribacteraceae bacterium]
MLPSSLKIVDKEFLTIDWNDSTKSKIKLSNLRLNCPCALCATDRENRSDRYFPIFGNDELTVSNLKMIGNYAIGISWKDGHNTGIYEFGYLKKLSII